jgi:hypothetical protein
MPRLRPRISLHSALLLMTVVGLALVVAKMWQEVGPLRSEVRRLRTEQGHLNIDDPSKAYVIKGVSYEENAWVWRIYLPPGNGYSLCFCSDKVPPLTNGWDAEWLKSLKRDRDWSAMTGTGFRGELLLEARLVKEGSHTKLHAMYSGADGGAGAAFAIGPKAGDRASGQLPVVSASFRIGTFQKSFPASQPILLRYDGGSTADQRDGFVIWIEPQPPSAAISYGPPK